MKNKKLRISLFEFLQTGRFGPFAPKRDCSPEIVMAIFGDPDRIETYGPIGAGATCCAGDERCFPIILAYGVMEFHFDAPSRMYTLFSDCFFTGCPVGGPLKLTDTALLHYKKPLKEFLALAKSRGLKIQSVIPCDQTQSAEVTTSGGIALHFEHDDATQAGSQATLRAFFWAHDFRTEP